MNYCDWSADTFAALKRLIEAQAPQGNVRKVALARIARLDPATEPPPQPDLWADLERSSLLQKDPEKILAAILRETGCDAEGAPHVIRGLLRKWPFVADPALAAALAAAFLDEAQCRGAHGLSERDKSLLRIMLVTPPPPKP